MAAHLSPECLPAPILLQPVLPRQHIVGIQWEEGWVYGTEGLGERQPASGKQLHPCPSACREPQPHSDAGVCRGDGRESPDTRKPAGNAAGPARQLRREQDRGCPGRCHQCPHSSVRAQPFPRALLQPRTGAAPLTDTARAQGRKQCSKAPTKPNCARPALGTGKSMG